MTKSFEASKLLQNVSKLRGFVSLCMWSSVVYAVCLWICAGKQTSPGFHHLRIQQVEVSDTVGVKALRIRAQSLDSFLHLHISKLDRLRCKFNKHSLFHSGYFQIWIYDMIWYVWKGDNDICKKNIDSDETSSKWHSWWITEVEYKLHLQCHKWWASVPSHSPWRYLQDPPVVAGTQQCSPQKRVKLSEFFSTIFSNKFGFQVTRQNSPSSWEMVTPPREWPTKPTSLAPRSCSQSTHSWGSLSSQEKHIA